VELLHELTRAVTDAGCAVRFGTTRDGGALAVGYLGDGEPYTEYIRPSEDLDAYLAVKVRVWTGQPVDPVAVAGRGAWDRVMSGPPGAESTAHVNGSPAAESGPPAAS
jgi:hypothetical protein